MYIIIVDSVPIENAYIFYYTFCSTECHSFNTCIVSFQMILNKRLVFDFDLCGPHQSIIIIPKRSYTWMSQEVSKWLVNGM